MLQKYTIQALIGFVLVSCIVPVWLVTENLAAAFLMGVPPLALVVLCLKAGYESAYDEMGLTHPHTQKPTPPRHSQSSSSPQ